MTNQATRTRSASDEIKKTGQRRLSINLPEPVFEELQRLADSSHRSMTELVRDAFALAKIAYDETDQGNKLAVLDKNGRTLKELVLVR